MSEESRLGKGGGELKLELRLCTPSTETGRRPGMMGRADEAGLGPGGGTADSPKRTRLRCDSKSMATILCRGWDASLILSRSPRVLGLVTHRAINIRPVWTSETVPLQLLAHHNLRCLFLFFFCSFSFCF